MQNCYVGDVGDFGKYGLLRYLTGMTGPPLDERKKLRLGVVWYLRPNDDPKTAGSSIGYLGQVGNNERLGECDCDLWHKLRKLVFNDDRFVSRVQTNGILKNDTILPANTLYHDTLLHNQPQQQFRDNPAAWCQRALEKTNGAQFVYVDPDIGIKWDDDPVERRSPSHVYIEELRRYWERGQSIVVYQTLRGNNAESILNWARDLQRRLNLYQRPIALWFHRVAARVFFVIPQKSHLPHFTFAVIRFLASGWDRYFTWL